MRRGIAIVAALLVLLGGYWLLAEKQGPSVPDPVEGGPLTVPSGGGDSSTEPAGPGAQAPASGVALALEGEGLRFFDIQTGSASPIPFGTPAELTLSALAATAGGEIAEEGASAECGNQYARLANGLTIWLRQDKFVGWSLREPPLTTAGGIGIGSTRAELESVYDARIVESSLGVEFSAGGLAGVLASDSPDARVQNLWAGETCIAR